METMIEYVHRKCKEKPVNISIDFTMGNGHDTLMLSQISKQVYSFDIQELALKNTKEKVQHCKHVTLLLENHFHFDQYVNSFDLGIFNLGYLPGGDHQITTKKNNTLATLKKALGCLNQQGRIFLVVYIGHISGKMESEAIDSYVSTLSNKDYNVSRYQMMNKGNSPYVIEIEKR